MKPRDTILEGLQEAMRASGKLADLCQDAVSARMFDDSAGALGALAAARVRLMQTGLLVAALLNDLDREAQMLAAETTPAPPRDADRSFPSPPRLPRLP